MGAKYIAKKRLFLAGEWREVGFQFDTDDFGSRRYEMMVRRGEIEPDLDSSAKSPSVAPAEDEGVAPGPDGPGVAPLPDEEPEEEFDIESLSRGELIKVLEDAGVTLDQIETTGANGYATVEDLKAAINGLEVG